MESALPEGMTSEQFGQAISEFVKIVGPKNVHTSEQNMRKFAKFLISADLEDHLPPAALFPEKAEEVCEILKICNKYKVPLWVSSTGKNLGYGAMAPCRRGTVILSLRRMNRIINLNQDLCYALVEPGVTYKQLYDYIDKNNYRLWLNIPTGPTPVAGPVGTSMDRGTGYTPYGDNFEHVCGMEIILPDGTVLKTGMGGIPNASCWQLYKWGYGPSLDGIFSQSNFGICVKMGLWLMPEPESFLPFVITFQRHEDLADIVETLRPLRLANVIPNACSIAPAYESEDYADVWNIYAALYGTSEQIEVNRKIVAAAFAKFENSNFFTKKDLGEHPSFKMRANLMKGFVPEKPYSTFSHANFIVPIVPTQGQHALKASGIADTIINKFGFTHNAEWIVGCRSMHHVIEIPFKRNDAESSMKARSCYFELTKVLAQNGYGLYRTNIAFMDEVGATYGPAIQNVFKKIKRALDPNEIISPGKAGIKI